MYLLSWRQCGQTATNVNIKFIIYDYSLALGQQSDLAKLPVAINEFVSSGYES